MSIKPLCASALKVLELNANEVGEKKQKVITDCISKYAMPSACSEKVSWAFYRIWNAVKHIFGMSDWQAAKRLICEVALKEPTGELDKNLKIFDRRSQELAEKNLSPLAKGEAEIKLNLERQGASVNLNVMSATMERVVEYVLSAALDIENLNRRASDENSSQSVSSADKPHGGKKGKKTARTSEGPSYSGGEPKEKHVKNKRGEWVLPSEMGKSKKTSSKPAYAGGYNGGS